MNPLKQKMTMKTKKLLWAALSMTAALMMTACSSDDNDTTEAPVAPSTTKTIPYTVTVGGDKATTRATVDSDNKTLRFATGDKLYIWGEKRRLNRQRHLLGRTDLFGQRLSRRQPRAGRHPRQRTAEEGRTF